MPEAPVVAAHERPPTDRHDAPEETDAPAEDATADTDTEEVVERTPRERPPDPTEHPVVKRALELFNGKIVEVHPKRP